MKKKIICFSDSFDSGGAQKQMILLANGLANKRYDVATLQYHDLNFFAHLLNNNVQIYKKIETNKIIRALKLLVFFYNKRPDIIISYLPAPNFYASLYKFIFFWRKVILITGERNFNINGISLKELFFRIPHLIANKVICNSNAQHLLLKKYFGSKIIFIPNGADVNNIKQKVYNSENSKKLTLVVAATFWLQKNPLGLVKALNIVKSKIDVRIDWYGQIIYKDNVVEETLDFIKSNRLENNINFYPPNKQIYDVIANSDALILPSFYEGCSNAIIDAMLVGVPVLASNVGDNRLYLNHHKELLFDPNKPEEIAAVLLSFSKLTTMEKKELGNLNRQKAISFFSTEKLVQNYMSLINSI